MNYAALYGRILRKVDDQSYLPLVDSVADAAQRQALQPFQQMMLSRDFDAALVLEMLSGLAAAGRIDRVIHLSCQHAVATKQRDHTLAARLVGEQEMAAIELGGPNLQSNLASVERHRGVLAFRLGSYDVALDYFSRAFERQRSAGNLSNVLATLIRLGDEGEARELLQQVQRSLPTALVAELNRLIALDPDLSLLRSEP